MTKVKAGGATLLQLFPVIGVIDANLKNEIKFRALYTSRLFVLT